MAVRARNFGGLSQKRQAHPDAPLLSRPNRRRNRTGLRRSVRMASMNIMRESGKAHAISKRHSLVIPVYRNEDNIPALLEVLEELNRKLKGLEVVCVVDGSPDRSGELLVSASE